MTFFQIFCPTKTWGNVLMLTLKKSGKMVKPQVNKEGPCEFSFNMEFGSECDELQLAQKIYNQTIQEDQRMASQQELKKVPKTQKRIVGDNPDLISAMNMIMINEILEQNDKKIQKIQKVTRKISGLVASLTGQNNK